MRILEQSNSTEKRERGDYIIFVDIKKISGKSLTMPKKTVKPNPLSCLVTTKSLKTMVAESGTLWKHPRLLFSKVGKPRQIV